MGLPYVDVVFCHRPDPLTPIEEVVRGFNNAIDRGMCFYWGTSEWSAQELTQAFAIADRLGLQGPVMDQPQYNLLERERVEVEYAPLYPRLGLTTWSPLASGVLTGKYSKDIPAGSRLSLPEFKKRPDYKSFLKNVQKAEQLVPIAERLGVTPGQLSLAWCAKNENVSTVILGATSVAQMRENLGALDVLPLLTPEVMQELDLAMGTKPRPSKVTAQVTMLRPRARY